MSSRVPLARLLQSGAAHHSLAWWDDTVGIWVPVSLEDLAAEVGASGSVGSEPLFADDGSGPLYNEDSSGFLYEG